jgi:hypothetical protein
MPQPERRCTRSYAVHCTNRIVVERAKGVLRERLEVSIENAVGLRRDPSAFNLTITPPHYCAPRR